ncbi:MAG: hypothetical protein IT422_24315 [Pirellulaceae bacterium]|jgi:hypothetical protein|nr:hypothetical protein [Pirellulaceae bacterium]
MKRFLFLLTVLLILNPTQFGSTSAQDSHPRPALYGTDALGRSLPEASDVREFRKDRQVGIFYFTWLNLNEVHDNTQILAKYPDALSTTASPPWGPKNAYHFWGEPLFGYYRSDDPWILRRHAELLSDAGVDFLVFDATNAAIYQDVILKLLQVFEEQRQLGERVPQVTFMVNTQAGETADRILQTFYKSSHHPENEHPELWFRWQGKPLLLCDPAEASPEVAEFFTLRKAHWPFELVNTHNAWHWEATYPQVYSYDTDPSKPEEVNVSVGQNLRQSDGRVEMMSTGNARGRSFHGGKVDTRPDAYQYGFNFEEQWQRAFELDPEIVFVTGWNEWIAMQLNHGEGRPVFCDQFDAENSRDVEMMKGGYADNYYLQLAANIRRYKGMNPPPTCSLPTTIDIAGPFEQWNQVSYEYQDHANETLPRDHAGCGNNHYRVTTGRNDFRVLKVAQDAKNLYFYAQTSEPISPSNGENWMWLLLDIKDSNQPNWEGFHFLVNRQRSTPSETSIESCAGQWNWQSAGTANYRVEGNQMQLAIPKSALGIENPSYAIEFKWLDNTQSPGEIMDLYTNGDTAPSGRLRYRFEFQ